MGNGLFILMAVLAFSTNTLMTRTFQIKFQNSKHAINLYQALFCFTASVAYLSSALVQRVKFDIHILLPALLFGGCFSLAVLCSARCMEMGLMSLSSVITNLSLVLPVIFSWTVLGEAVELNAVIGLALIILTLVLSSLSASNDKCQDFKKWLLFVSIAFLANGSSAIVQKQYKAQYGSEDLMMFMGCAYFISCVIFAVTYIKRNAKSELPVSRQIKHLKLFPLIFAVSGLGSFAGNGLLGYLCDKVNGGVLYPCINGGLCVVVAISSFLIFKEKPSKNKVAAIFTGVLAIVLLNL